MNLIILFLLLISNYSHANTYYNVQQLQNSSGIFYDKLGLARLSNSKLTLLTHLNITHLQNAHSVAHNNYDRIVRICNAKTIQFPNITFDHCSQPLKNIQKEIEEIDRKSEILDQLVNYKPGRFSRGLIDGGSYALNWLFGVPDADDAQYYIDSINSLVNNNKQTQILLKTQIQIITSTIKNFNNSLTSLREQEQTMNTNIQKINQYFTNNNKRINYLELMIIISSHISALSSLVAHLLSKYTEYIDALNLGKHNILSPTIVTPRNLVHEMKRYKGEYDLLLNLDHDDITTLYNLAKVQIIFDKDMIIFAIHFPLVQKNIYDFYHLIPLPIQHQNSSYFSFINPKNKYLLMAQSMTQYSYVQDLSDCIEYLHERYVCIRIHATQTTERTSCEVQLLSPHITQLPRDCDTSTIKAVIETWKYVRNNQWIYVLQRPITVTTLCTGEKAHMEDIILHQTGIFSLHSQCKAYTESYVLESTNRTSQNISFYVPTIRITEEDCCIRLPNISKEHTELLQTVHLTNVDLNDFKYASKKLSEFDEALTKQINEPSIATHHKWYTTVLLAIGSIICLIILFNCCRWCGCFNLLRRFCCFTRNPANGQLVSPIIKNFVNCNFDSNFQSDYHREAPEQICYHHHVGPDPPINTTTSSTHTEDEVILMSSNPPRRLSVKPRRSTTPL
ncbi:uncharacterized protein LOC135164593 [Diachasmimorpha longicaudata]|uniref:uncharacterized protein LOC135164593 n=1 Tax=Diachasmimorpha longicaudata TaxID=58733 RepID=UPI0030B8DA7F